MADTDSFQNLTLERRNNVFIITLRKGPENRLDYHFCQEIIRAFRTVQNILGPSSPGAVITRGQDAKFWCTVGYKSQQKRILRPIAYHNVGLGFG